MLDLSNMILHFVTGQEITSGNLIQGVSRVLIPPNSFWKIISKPITQVRTSPFVNEPQVVLQNINNQSKLTMQVSLFGMIMSSGRQTIRLIPLEEIKKEKPVIDVK